MKRDIRFVGQSSRTGEPLAVVTTTRSIWNPLMWFGSKAWKETKAYKREDGVFMDFAGQPADPETANFINREMDKLEKPNEDGQD